MRQFAGVLFFLAGTVILLGILTAEIFYPTTYSISQNMISNLGATPPPSSIVRQPSADIFDGALMIAGILVLMGSGVVQILFRKKLVSIPLMFLGMGTFGVGIFPAFHAVAHPLVALTAFLAGGVSAIVSSKITKNPFAIVSIVLGTLCLIVLFLGIIFPQSIVPILGRGGTERWVLYPLVLWLTGFGGYLMSDSRGNKK